MQYNPILISQYIRYCLEKDLYEAIKFEMDKKQMNKKRVVVCGTNYGRFYLSAFLKQNHDFQLVGILAKGSERSKKIAREFGVPLFLSVDSIPEDVEIACIAVKSTVLGGDGTRLAMDFLKRGVHVIQEHPVHPADIRHCMKLAEKNGTHYHVNSHFVHIKPVKIFIDYIQQSITRNRPLFIDVSTALLYSTLDILGHALGTVKPFAFNPVVEWSGSTVEQMKTDIIPFKCIQGVISGIPVCFCLQNYFNPDDAVHNYLIMHRICIGSETGNIILLNPHGPVIWSQGYPSGNDKDDPALIRPTSILFSEGDAPSYQKIMTQEWPSGVLSALNELRNVIETGQQSVGQTEEYLINISELWLELGKRFGRPQLIEKSVLEGVYPDPVQYRDSIESF